MTVLTVQACFVAEDMFGKECGGLTHGGEIEALAVLAYRPEPGAPGAHRLFVGPRSRAQGGRAAAHAELPAGVDGCAFDCAYGLVWEPQHATIEKAQKMLNSRCGFDCHAVRRKFQATG